MLPKPTRLGKPGSINHILFHTRSGSGRGSSQISQESANTHTHPYHLSWWVGGVQSVQRVPWSKPCGSRAPCSEPHTHTFAQKRKTGRNHGRGQLNILHHLLSFSLSHIYTETTQDLKCPVTVTRSVPESEVQNEWKLQRRFLTRKFWSFLHPLDGAMVPTTGWWWWILSNERERLNIITLIYTSNIPGAYRSISIRLFCRFSLFTELKPKPNQLN